MSRSFKNALAALGLLAVGAASAQSIQLQYLGTAGRIETTTLTSNYLSGAMSFGTEGQTSFEAFCIEPGQVHASVESGLQTYVEGSFSAPQTTLLQNLFSSSYSSVSTDLQKAAFQTAVWEIVHESNATLGARTGTFQFAWLSSPVATVENNAFIELTNQYLTQAQSYVGADLYTLAKLTNPNFQDLLTATPIPEPSSYAMMLAGLCAVGAIVRRRRQQR